MLIMRFPRFFGAVSSRGEARQLPVNRIAEDIPAATDAMHGTDLCNNG